MDRNSRKRRVTIGAAALLATLVPVAVYAQDNACTTYNEAPQLAERVAAGDLPPVAERLPEHPVVLTPAEQVGTYGGIMNSLYDGGRVADFRMYGYEGLVRWSPDGNDVVPNIAESWEVNEDGTRYTFHLRKGMKWSDGQPFTADDILFWWDRVENNPDIVPTPYSIYLVKGEAAKVEKLDDYTVAFSWSNPNGLFLLNLAAAYGTRIGQFAKHYLEQFDNKANPEGVAKMMAEAGQTTYGTWWISRVGTYGQPAEYNDPKRPLLQAWIPTEPYIGAERFTFVRNPYYFKVDTACNQLPYIDGRTFTLATDPQLRVLKTVSGEDFLSRDDVSQPVNRSVFFDNQETGNFHFVDVQSSDFNTMLLHLELNNPDQAQGAILNDKDFRIGMSLAMDRQTVIDTVFLTEGEPWQQAPRANSPFYNEQLAKQYTDYDPAAANEHLDKIMPQKDADGFRLRSDGQRFKFNVMVNATARATMVDILELLQKNWKDVGVDVVIVSVADDTFWSRRQDPAIDAYVWIGENGSGLLPVLGAGFYAFTPEAAWNWIAWQQRQLDPNAKVTSDPIEPPANIQRQYEILAELKVTFDTDAQAALMKELLQLSADDFYTIGLSLPSGDYKVVNNTLRNVPEPLITGWFYPGPAPVNFETFYIDASKAK